MKVFFGASPRVTVEMASFYKIILSELKASGFQVSDNSLNNITPNHFNQQTQEGKITPNNYYKEITTNIRGADLCIFETTIPSSGLGFVIQKSLMDGKPTIVLYYKDHTPFFIAGSDDEKLILKSYNDKNLKKILKEAILLAKDKRDKRFNFFISPKLLDYLEKASNVEGVTKSKFIRGLIVEHMHRTSA